MAKTIQRVPLKYLGLILLTNGQSKSEDSLKVDNKCGAALHLKRMLWTRNEVSLRK